MLSRVARRSAQASQFAALLRSPTTLVSRPKISALQASASAIWLKGYAKNNRPVNSRFPASDNLSSNKEAAKSDPPENPQQRAFEPETSSQPREPDNQEKEQPSQEQEPDLSKLPDLTQGIPSTLEYETAGFANRSSLSTVEESDAATSSTGGRGRGELPASAYISSSERRRSNLLKYVYAGTAVVLVGSTIYLGRDWDEDEVEKHKDVPNGWGLGLWWNRAVTRLSETTNYYQEPSFEKLLPDPDPMFERPYTLCISLEDMLVHSEWSREHGWRMAKRPGVDYFLHYLSQYYELVLFTSAPFYVGEPILRKLDPFRFIVWPLFREATKYKDGEIVKDLSYLNRDLSKVIMIDTDAAHVQNQPENAIIIPKWTGDPKDKELVALIPFLEYIHTMQYGDVRKILKSFEGKHIPTEFARREAIARAEFNKQLEAKNGSKKAKGPGGGIGLLASSLGLKPSNMSLLVVPDGEQNPTEAFAQGKMLQDIARERGQRNYEMLEREIRENGEKWLKEEAELQEKAQKEAMSSMKSSFTSWFGVKSDEKAKNDEKPIEEKK